MKSLFKLLPSSSAYLSNFSFNLALLDKSISLPNLALSNVRV
ncbi:hypothetical protein QQA45_06350 [Sneathia sanguinegens]|uniref:Uncharacterized protein n=1 Tax=Sneathia sanguinegens TaxID=40543 RepID=A0ABT7HLV7_9FUSO|nr:hypothetical protein [Sneathia sanguinegens]MDK9581112.1 hypothetical protein [Sneathia sanguinegens]